METKRYSRQIALPEVGSAGQKRLSSGRVLCLGAGGLGSPVALYLAAAGVGRIGVIDHDQVDTSNLQRQILFRSADQGRAKADVAKQQLEAMNPSVQVVAHVEQFTHLNAEALLADYDLVVDGSDNFETRFLANDAACKRGIPLVYGAVSRFEGQTALFWGARGACYRCLHPAAPQAEVRNCAEAGVLGAVVGVIGSLQANLALQCLISGGDPEHPLTPVVGQLSILDLAGKWDFRSLHIPKRPNCPTCSLPPSAIELQFTPQSCARTAAIDPGTLLKLLEKHSARLVLLDVRETEEWDSGHLPGAIHWPLARLERGELPPSTALNTQIIAYCQAGARSDRAVSLLLKAGFTESRSLTGGIACWAGLTER